MLLFFFLMIRRPPRSTQSRSSAASDVYKRQHHVPDVFFEIPRTHLDVSVAPERRPPRIRHQVVALSLIHISEPTRLLSISYAVFCLTKKKTHSSTSYFMSSILTINILCTSSFTFTHLHVPATHTTSA